MNFKKILENIFKYKSINLLLNIIKYKKHIYSKNPNFVFLPLKGSIIDFKKNSKIIINNSLKLNFNKIPNSNSKILIQLCENAKFIIHDSLKIGYNTDILVKEDALLEIYSGYLNADVEIRCAQHIKIGKNCAIARGVKILDSDFHSIYFNDEIINPSKKITLGDNVWIGTGAMILKGVTVGNNVVIGAGTIVTKDIPNNCIVAGNPAQIIKKNIKWTLKKPPIGNS